MKFWNATLTKFGLIIILRGFLLAFECKILPSVLVYPFPCDIFQEMFPVAPWRP